MLKPFEKTRYVVDECRDVHGWLTIRESDGSPNGDTNAHPVATVYADLAHHQVAELLAAAPEMLECCEATLAYMLDDSRSPRRRAANIKALRTAIAQAKGKEGEQP